MSDGFCRMTGKVRYPSRSEATKANHGMHKRRLRVSGKKAAKGVSSAYLCRGCGGWHLGRERT